MFYVTEMVDGQILWNDNLPDLEPFDRRAVYSAKVKTMDLHTIDWRSVGLDGFGPEHKYAARQIDLWSTQYKESETVEIPEMDALIDWLPKNIPACEKPTIVHGNYRFDNIVLHRYKQTILAVLGWESAAIGDPLADFIYDLLNWVTPGHGALVDVTDLSALYGYGIPSFE